jgi:hypothetical protein
MSDQNGGMHHRTCQEVVVKPRTSLWCLTKSVMLSRNACMMYVDDSKDAMETRKGLNHVGYKLNPLP